jgi:acetoin utilization protein AcuB
MLVRERMTPNPVTITPDTSVPDALILMRERKVRRFPELDRHGKLAGIVSEKDLLHAAPSPATTLSVWEIKELLGKLKVSEVMTREVITISEDTPLEEAARLMADNRIAGLPVMRGKTVVGIITETDLFKSLLELLGGRRKGVRLTVLAPGVKGTLAKITGAIFEVGGDIVGLGFREMTATAGQPWEVTLKVQDAEAEKLVAAVRQVVTEILDVRET